MKTQRERWADVANLYAGLSAPDPYYVDVIAPERLEGLQLSHAMLAMWCCALFWLGLARAMLSGVLSPADFPELLKSYKISEAMSDCIAVAVRLGAWRTYTPGRPLPSQGDGVIIGPGGYHMRGCLVTVPDENGKVDIVEGGHMTPLGRMSIERVTAHLRVVDGALYLGESIGPSTKVYGWIDCTALPEGDTHDEIAKDAQPTDRAPATDVGTDENPDGAS